MKDRIYTIGFTKKKAEEFFTLLKENNIEIILDIRLNNTSQLAGFTKFPDVKYLLREICNIEYIHDVQFSPSKETLKRYKSKEIEWKQYIIEFNNLMGERKIEEYILKHYNLDKKICLLCSEVLAQNCHRSLVADRFKEIFKSLNIINL